MPADNDSAKPIPTPEAIRSRQLATGRQMDPSPTMQGSHRGSILKYLRPIMFLLILLAAVGTGFHYKSKADPGVEPALFRDQPPQYINVYVTNPRISVTLNVTLYQGTYLSPITLKAQGYTDFTEEVDITARTPPSVNPGSMIIASSAQPVGAPGGPDAPFIDAFRMKGGSDAASSFAQAERFVAPLQLTQENSTTWSDVVSFNSISAIYRDSGSTFAHLPSVGAFEFAEGRPPTFFAEYSRRTGQFKSVVFAGVSVPAIPAGDGGEFLYGPASASYVEVLHNIVPVIGNEQVDYMIPSVDSNSDIDYVWSSNGISGLEPTFESTDPDAIDSQNQAAFISGIAFGVAGAAGIAVVQELPKERRARPGSRRDAEDDEPLN